MKGVRVLIGFFIIVASVSGAETKMNQTQTNAGKGILEGKVTIGPLHPGPVRVGEEEQPIDPAIFAPLRVVIYGPDGKEIHQVKLDARGYYKVELDPGKYLVGITPQKYGIRPGARIRQEAIIESGKTTKLNIDIDTGIR